MERDKLTDLIRRLYSVEGGKRRGTIGEYGLQKLIEAIEHIEANLADFHKTEHCKLSFGATIAQSTSRTYYYATNPSVTYCGPYTVIEYSGGDYQIERVDSETSLLAWVRSYSEGIELRFDLIEGASVNLSALGAVMKDIAEIQTAKLVRSHTNSFSIVFLSPMSVLYREVASAS